MAILKVIYRLQQKHLKERKDIINNSKIQQINNSKNIIYTTFSIILIYTVQTYSLKTCGNFKVIYHLQQQHLKERKDIIYKRHNS